LKPISPWPSKVKPISLFSGKVKPISLLALLLAGCGFTGEPPYDGRRIADVAPWEDVGPLTICDGPTRLGTLDADAVGLCAGATPAAACGADGDCRSRERCVCGRCTVAVCDSADECGPALTCSFAERRCDRACDADGDCAPGESCVPGMHVCRGGCSTTGDCQTGETCQSSTGLCVAVACADDSTCLGGRSCLVQRTPSGLAEPSPLVESGQVILYFERTDPGGAPAVYRATSTDGFQFTIDPPGALVAGRAPSVLHDPASGGYTMVYVVDNAGAPALTHAASPDGAAFTPSGTIDLAGGEEPSVVSLPDGTWVYFTIAESGVERAQLLAGGALGQPAQVLAPAALSDPVLWRGVDRIASPFAQSLTGPDGEPFVRLWFAARGVDSADSLEFGESVPTPPDYSIGEAASTDGRSFVPYPFNPVFTRVLDFLTHPSELDPAVIALGDTWLLYYRRAAADGSQSENLAAARSPQQPQ
jgi:hypothetical protein